MVTVIVNLFAPFSVGVNQKTIVVNKNIASAAAASSLGTISLDLRNKAKDQCLKSGLPLKEFCWGARASMDGTNSVVGLFIYLVGIDHTANDIYTFSVGIADDSGVLVTSNNTPVENAIEEDDNLHNPADITTDYDGYSFVLNPVNGLVKGKVYTIHITILKNTAPISGASDTTNTLTLSGILIPESGTQLVSDISGSIQQQPDYSGLPACGILNGALGSSGTWGGCVIWTVYYILFVPTSFVFAMTGTFFDFAFNYSIQDTSYRSPFVVQGWGIVRDFCNMFFIFVLLYIAFSTILNLNGSKTKEMIINVIIIGLLINFSLFFTQVMIDTSNILARVFYNSNTIKITQGNNAATGGAVGSMLKTGPNGEIPLSAAIVNKINPQNLIINGTKKVNLIEDKGGLSQNSKDGAEDINTTSFLLIVLLASVINIVGTIVFLTVALVFVGRVVGLWLAMILSPFVFFSYTVPAMQDMEMVGWKRWWPETLKLAFVAPIFIFFMYLIVAFLETGLSLIPSAEGTSGMTWVMSIILPFIFIMVLLMKAKGIAVKMSGDIGTGVAKIGSAVGGAALGAGVGMAAFAGRNTIGKMGDKVAKSKWATGLASSNNKFASFIGNKTMDAGQKVAKKSFDVRSTAIGAAAGAGLGVALGKGKEGGYTGAMERKQAKDLKRSKDLELGGHTEEVKDLNEKEELLQELKNMNANVIEALKGKYEVAQKDLSDKTQRANNLNAIANQEGATPEQKEEARAARDDANKASKVVEDIKKHQNAVKKAEDYEDIDGIKHEYSNRKKEVNVSESLVSRSEASAVAAEKNSEEANNTFSTKKTNAEKEASDAIIKIGIDTQAEIEAAKNMAKLAQEKAQEEVRLAKQLHDQESSDPEFKKAYDEAMANLVKITKASSENVINVTTAAQTKATTNTDKITKDKEATIKTAKENVVEKQEKARVLRLEADNYADARKNKRKISRNMSQLEFEDVADQKFKISEINSKAKNTYADTKSNSWFNKRINKQTAHMIRMNSEIKSK